MFFHSTNKYGQLMSLVVNFIFNLRYYVLSNGGPSPRIPAICLSIDNHQIPRHLLQQLNEEKNKFDRYSITTWFLMMPSLFNRYKFRTETISSILFIIGTLQTNKLEGRSDKQSTLFFLSVCITTCSLSTLSESVKNQNRNTVRRKYFNCF